MNTGTMMQQLRKALEMFVETLPDEQAVGVASVSKHWKENQTVNVGERRYYPKTERLYKCIIAHTTSAEWTPDITPNLWAVIDEVHTGTKDDPIPAARGMEYAYGKYYLDPEDGNIYICIRSEQSGTIILQYLPHELVGSYFENAEVPL